MAVSNTLLRGFTVAISAAAAMAVGVGPATADPGPGGHLFGAYAVSGRLSDGSYNIGAGWNYPDQDGADGRALAECGDGSCTIALRFQDGCGAIAFRGDNYAGGAGPTGDDATRNAVNAVGPPWPSSISADAANPAQVFGPDCTG